MGVSPAAADAFAIGDEGDEEDGGVAGGAAADAAAEDTLLATSAASASVSGGASAPHSSGTAAPQPTARDTPLATLCCFCGARGRAGARARRAAWLATARPIKEFFAPQLRRTSVLLMVIWFALSLGWYGLTLWIPTIFHESNVELNEYQVRAPV